MVAGLSCPFSPNLVLFEPKRFVDQSWAERPLNSGKRLPVCVTKFRDPVGVPTLLKEQGNSTIGMLRDTPVSPLALVRR